MQEIMGFWGLHVVPGKVYTQVVDASFKLSMAALGEELASDLRSSLKVNINKNEYVLCSLTPGKLEQQPLDVVFTEGEEITFSATGDNSIYLTGNYLPDTGDGEMDEDIYPYSYGLEDDEDDDDDDEGEDDSMTLLEESGIPLIKTRGAKRLATINMVDTEDDSDSDDENYVDEGDDDEEEEEEDDDEDDGDMNEDDESGVEKEIMAALSVAAAKKRAAKEKEPPTKKIKMDTGKQTSEENIQQKANGPQKLSPNDSTKGQVENAKKNQNKPGVTVEERAKNEKKNEKTKKEKKDEKKTIARTDEKAEKKQQNEIMKVDDTKESNGSSKKEHKKDGTNEDKAANKKEQKKENNNANKSPVKSQEKQAETPKSLRKELPNGLVIEDIKVGDGPKAKAGKRVGMRYIGKLTNDKVFDKNVAGPPFSFRLGAGEVIKGWDLGIVGMAVGGERRLIIPPELAYGAKGSPPDIPKSATLKFEVKLLSMK